MEVSESLEPFLAVQIFGVLENGTALQNDCIEQNDI